MKKVLLIINEKARKGHRVLTEAIRYLRSYNLEIFSESPEYPQIITEIINSYKHQVDLVVIGGGDGTLNAALPGLINTGLPLGILPLGTANDLARTLGIPLALGDACQVIANGKIRYIDLGMVNGRYFLNVASLGLSVQITEKLNHEVKRRWGILAYAIAACQVLLRARPFKAEIRANGEIFKVKTVQIAIGNGRYYGGGMAIAVDATIDDQRLDLYSLEVNHWWQIITLLPVMYRGDHAQAPGVRTLCGQEIEIYTRRPRFINTDGEITTMTPAHFQVIPHILPVIAP